MGTIYELTPQDQNCPKLQKINQNFSELLLSTTLTTCLNNIPLATTQRAAQMIIGNDNRDNISRQSYAKRSFEQSEIRTPWRGKEDVFGRNHIRFSGCVLDVPKMQSGGNLLRSTLKWVDNSAIRFIRFLPVGQGDNQHPRPSYCKSPLRG